MTSSSDSVRQEPTPSQPVTPSNATVDRTKLEQADKTPQAQKIETPPSKDLTTPKGRVSRLVSSSSSGGGPEDTTSTLAKMSQDELIELFLKQRQATLRYKGRFSEVGL